MRMITRSHVPLAKKLRQSGRTISVQPSGAKIVPSSRAQKGALAVRGVDCLRKVPQELGETTQKSYSRDVQEATYLSGM